MGNALLRLFLDVAYVAIYFVLIYAFAQGVHWLTHAWQPSSFGAVVFGCLEYSLICIDALGVVSAAILGTIRSLRILMK